jgi:hypothetical protein
MPSEHTALLESDDCAASYGNCSNSSYSYRHSCSFGKMRGDPNWRANLVVGDKVNDPWGQGAVIVAIDGDSITLHSTKNDDGEVDYVVERGDLQ